MILEPVIDVMSSAGCVPGPLLFSIRFGKERVSPVFRTEQELGAWCEEQVFEARWEVGQFGGVEFVP